MLTHSSELTQESLPQAFDTSQSPDLIQGDLVAWPPPAVRVVREVARINGMLCGWRSTYVGTEAALIKAKLPIRLRAIRS